MVLWLAATLARINKRKWSLKKEKIKQNLNAIAEDFSLKKLVYIQGSPALCQPFFPYKPHTQTFLTFQSKWAPEEELCLNNNSAFRGRNSTKFWVSWIIVIQMSGLVIHVTNFKITITNLNSKFCIYYLKSWYFLNNWSVQLPRGKKVQLYALPPHAIWKLRTEINKFDLVYRITRPFIKHNLKFRMQGP